MDDNAVDDSVVIENDGNQPAWKDSLAQKYLFGLLVRNELPGRSDITPKEVFDKFCRNRPEFKNFQDYKGINFASKLRSLRDKVEVKGNRAQEDAQFLAHDRCIFPPPSDDTKGHSWWPDSVAQSLLRKDILDNKHKNMQPKELYETREEYYSVYDLDFFRNKIYQEVKAMKREAWVKEKAKKNKK